MKHIRVLVTGNIRFRSIRIAISKSCRMFQSPPLDALFFEVCRTRPRYPAELRALMRQTRKVAAWNTAAHEYKYTTNLRSELGVLSEY
jgi:hypothetical protein